jgi:type IV pilus assembly protein PilW
MCATFNHRTGLWENEPLLEGVEAMQVLFGTDNVTPLSTPGAVGDSIVDRWLPAHQLRGPTHAATRENFRRVRAVRIGLVMRGPVGSAQERVAASLAPLGSPTFVDSAGDPGSQLSVTADGRLRRVITFTVHLRNELGLR